MMPEETNDSEYDWFLLYICTLAIKIRRIYISWRLQFTGSNLINNNNSALDETLGLVSLKSPSLWFPFVYLKLSFLKKYFKIFCVFFFLKKLRHWGNFQGNLVNDLLLNFQEKRTVRKFSIHNSQKLFLIHVNCKYHEYSKIETLNSYVLIYQIFQCLYNINA